MTLFLIAVVVLAGWGVSLYFWPFAACRRCGGNGRNAGSNSKRFGVCGRCGGSGRRQRFGSAAVHRAVRDSDDHWRKR